MPRPAPSTVPVSSPITKLPPPLPSFSKRSYPSAIDASCSSTVDLRRARKHGLERDARAPHDADDAARFRPYVGADPVRGVVDAIHRRFDRVVDAVGLFFHLGADYLDVVEDRVDARHRRRDVTR